MIFIDANIFLAYDNINDVHHDKAVMLLEKIKSGLYGSPFTSDYVFNEVVGVTFRKFGKERAVFLGNKLNELFVIFNIHDHLFNETWNFFSCTKLALNLVDCSNVVISKLTRTKYIATFDKEFSKLAEFEVVS